MGDLEGNEITDMESMERVESAEEVELVVTVDVEDRLSVGRFDFGYLFLNSS